MKMRRILSAFFGFLFLASLLLTVIDCVCFFRPFYLYEYHRDQTAQSIGMREDDLFASTNVLLDYLQDKRKDIIISAEVNGTEREVFDQRETLHMVDVKNLYQNVLKVRNAIGIIAILGIMLLFIKDKEKPFQIFSDAYKYGLLCILTIVIFVLVYAIADFYNFWMNFHYLFFDNDLFLLDPNISIMINMFPEIFFKDMVLSIIFIYGLIILLLGVVLRKVANR